MATNGVASGDSFYVGRGILCTFPYEFFVHPNSKGVQSSCPTLRASVPADGIYHARCYARDLAQYDNNGGGDGIRLGISASGFVPDQVVVSAQLAELWTAVTHMPHLETGSSAHLARSRQEKMLLTGWQI